MVEILSQAVAQVPALVVLCLLVYIFVNSLKAERTAVETIASEALDRNTEAMANNQRMIEVAVESPWQRASGSTRCSRSARVAKTFSFGELRAPRQPPIAALPIRTREK